MKLVFHCQVISPHHLSFANDLARRLGSDEFRYVYTTPLNDERKRLGWAETGREWMVLDDRSEKIKSLLGDCDVLVSSVRDIETFEGRSAAGRLTVYVSERWFKPFAVCGHLVSGRLRLLSPSYRRMVRRFRNLLLRDCPFYYFPMSIWAARDMASICGYHGEITFESRAGGRIFCADRLLNKFRIWAYFVESSASPAVASRRNFEKVRKVLWVGRLVGVKRVGDIVRAVELASRRGCNLQLDIYGHGDDEAHVRELAKGMPNVSFYDPVPVAQVRGLMREHDLYVLSSNAMEGWGAVVNEALEEGMRVIGTYEAGSSSTLLPPECLYTAGDVKRLSWLLEEDLPLLGIGGWSCRAAADVLTQIAESKEIK